MTVSLADIIMLERKLRNLEWRMSPKLVALKGMHSTEYDNPVQITYGSNSFIVDREHLVPLIDDDRNNTAWIIDTFAAFLVEHAGNK